jgi:hypothetical protein
LYFPGAPFIMGALLLIVSAVLAFRSMSEDHIVKH